MLFRVVNEQRLPQVMDLWAYSFEKKDNPFFQWYFSEYCCKDNMVIGGFDDDDKLQNMLHINPYMLKVRGYEQLTPYIVGVATAPEARGQHLFRPLLETAFEVLRAQEFPFVLLMPISAGIYLPYQFSYCYYRHGYDMNLDDLYVSKTGGDLKVQRMEPDKNILAGLYAEITSSWNGVPKRTDFQWNKLLKVHAMENVMCAVCYDGDKAAAYMLYSINGDTFNVVELLSLTQNARNRLLQYAAQHKSEAKRFTWLAEAWDKTYLQFKDQSVSGSINPFMMARCIDARLALAKLPLPEDVPEDSIVLLLTDNVIDRNNHLIKLKTSAKNLEVVSTMEQEDVIMDMGAFTQLYFGAFTATELYEAGLLKAVNKDKLQLLNKLFPKSRNYINEYF